MFESNLQIQILTYNDSYALTFFHFLQHIAEISWGLESKTPGISLQKKREAYSNRGVFPNSEVLKKQVFGFFLSEASEKEKGQS